MLYVGKSKHTQPTQIFFLKKYIPVGTITHMWTVHTPRP